VWAAPLEEEAMYEVEERVLQAQPAAVVRGKATVDEMPAFMQHAFAAVYTYVQTAGVPPTGPPFARFRPLDGEDGEFEVEVGCPVVRPVDGAGEVEPLTLPGGSAAMVWHVGQYDGMTPAYDALVSWLAARGATPTGLAWEIYYSDPAEQPDPATWRTQIVQPFASA
jgi:effector-binding domain-containing protein